MNKQEGITVFDEHITRTQELFSHIAKLKEPLIEAATLCTNAIRAGGKIVICGNGGSASDAQHIAGELINMYKNPNRKPLPALALSTDSSVLTCIGNDFSFDDIFAKQVHGLCTEKDVLIALSTSGNSKNILKAATIARQKKMKIIAFTGYTGGELSNCADILLNAPSTITPHVQEGHIALYHILCDLIERWAS